MHPPSALLGPRSKKSIPENIPYIFEKWHFLAIILKFFYILGNENPKTIPYNFSKESFPYSLENGTSLPPQKKNLYISRGAFKTSKTKISLSTTLYALYIIDKKKLHQSCN